MLALYAHKLILITTIVLALTLVRSHTYIQGTINVLVPQSGFLQSVPLVGLRYCNVWEWVLPAIGTAAAVV
jgi:hypothetical protein